MIVLQSIYIKLNTKIMINHHNQNSDQSFMQKLWGFSSIIYHSLNQTPQNSNNMTFQTFNFLQNSSYSLPQIKGQNDSLIQGLIFEDDENNDHDSLESYLDYTKCRCRGKSQMYDEGEQQNQQQLDKHPSSHSSTICLTNQQNKPHQQNQKQDGITSNNLSQNISEQDLLSSSNTGLQNNNLSNSAKNKITTGIEAKNVTKNIGNLLFKFIWKNRKNLASSLGISQEQWNQFIQIFTIWRKRTNITRQFLITRWHGSGFQAKIFRRISQNYFRKFCLTDIMKSNIRAKKIHYERIYRFQQSIIDVQGLNSMV